MHRKGCCRPKWLRILLVLNTLLALGGFLLVKVYHQKVISWRDISTSNENKIRTVKPTEEVASCQPKNRTVFIKTHKTGSSTITTILERYGSKRDLNFALPGHFSFSTFNKFHASEVYLGNPKDTNNSTPVWPSLGGFHILANHARYNREEMTKVIHNATYITIIRHPVAQFESTFSYYSLDRIVPTTNGSDSPLETFFRNPQRYFAVIKANVKGFVKNANLYDLGMDTSILQDPESVNQKISTLSSEMDLVMINEYFDESLILLKKLLCWEFDDILYIPQGVRKSTVRRNITADLRAKIQEWNQADVKLYQHFNRTLWEKIRRYGPNFQRDLETFRRLKEATTERCLANATIRWDSHKSGVIKLPQTTSKDCQVLVRYDMSWVTILKKRMVEKSREFLKRKRLHSNSTIPFSPRK